MNKLLLSVLMLGMSVTLAIGQGSMLFYNGGLAEDSADPWVWGFNDDVISVADAGYTPGTSALRWFGYDQGGYQGIFLSQNNSMDLSDIWASDSVYFKLRAPSGLNAEDADLNVVLYDSRNATWENCVYYTLSNFQDLNDGNWHQFNIALSDFVNHPDVTDAPIDPTDIVAVSFEYFDTGVASEFHIDKVYIGQADVPVNWVIFNGQTLSDNVGFYAWGFNNNDLQIVEGEGYILGTHAILWETSNWSWQGMDFWCDLNNAGTYLYQDFSSSWATDSLRIKIKAPAGINDLAIKFVDWSNNLSATSVLSEVAWDGEWQLLSIALADFTMDEGFDISNVYWLKIEAAVEDMTIAERVLITDIWTGNPALSVDFVAPEAPAGISVDNSSPYVNLVAPDDIVSENGETYNVYYSANPITDLADGSVIFLASVAEQDAAPHLLYTPLEESAVSYYYAATCTDAAGNTSETFFALGSAVANTGKARAVINFGAPPNFAADGDFSEWEDIVPFRIKPAFNNIETGSVTDSLDLSVYCYLAIDNENLYVAFDVIDDVFSWQEGNTSDWWNDESIEFFIGFYDIIGSVSHHNYWGRGAEPDYRIVFRPDRYTYDAWPNEGTVMASDENYFFESGGISDYFIEAKIPLDSLASLAGDDVFSPLSGMKIPLEIQMNDNDVIDGGDATISRMHFGENSLESPWNNNPDVWTFTWILDDGASAIGDVSNVIPVEYALGNNYPNPFNPQTTFDYSIAEKGNVKIEIFNTLGQSAAVLFNGPQTTGSHKITFDASHLPSGLYFYKITSQGFRQTKKMLLIK